MKPSLRTDGIVQFTVILILVAMGAYNGFTNHIGGAIFDILMLLALLHVRVWIIWSALQFYIDMWIRRPR